MSQLYNYNAIETGSREEEGASPKLSGGDFLRSTFSFNRMPFTLLTVVVYGALMWSIASIQDARTPALATRYPPSYSVDAWHDLQQITQSHHPFNSHANDKVYEYLLGQVKRAASGHPGVVVEEDDGRTMYSQYSASTSRNNVNYYEGNNILVKIPGTNNSLEAVLVSAHFDSVATGYGAIDAGTGVVSALAALRYFLEANTTLTRPVIFNFNNNEEMGLLGAEAFAVHPWKDEVGFFVNLEGAGANGRPILFRATDYGVASHYSASPNPHGSSIFQQGFDSGAIHSDTDYTVYKKIGYRGLDIAFYKSRSLYHTRRDNIHASSIEAISQMLSSTIAATASMANATEIADADEPAVYFDLFNKYFLCVPLSVLISWNLTGLFGILILGLFFAIAVRKGGNTFNGKKGWGRGLVSLAVSTIVTVLAGWQIAWSNSLVFISQTYTPVFSLLALFVLVNYTILGPMWYLHPVHDQKLVILIELLLGQWILLLITTILAAKKNMTGLFLFTILYYCTYAAVLFGLIGIIVSPPPQELAVHNPDEPESSENSENRETTQLIPTQNKEVHKGPHYDWSVQFLLLIPIGVLVLFTVGSAVLDGSHQTLIDGLDDLPVLVYTVSGLAILLGALIVPFVHRMHILLALGLACYLVVGGIHASVSFPFTYENPVKFSAIQRIDLDDTNPAGITPLVNVVGHEHYLRKALADVPSARTNNITCHSYAGGRVECAYEAARPWIVKNPDYNELLQVDILKQTTDKRGLNQAKLKISAPDNRICSLKFHKDDPNEKSAVRVVKVYHEEGNHEMAKAQSRLPEENVVVQDWLPGDDVDSFSDSKGIDDFTLYKFDWNQTYVVGFEWLPTWFDAHDRAEDDLKVDITCYWNEYEASIPGTDKPRMPAITELLHFSPEWTTYAKYSRGMLEVNKRITL
ncbi:vacuolar membrane protease [Trichomonascus vanleenenianus]|uniref:Pff1p n=1 Tax=Trichomonascus vanleenenianus TaxID=2268995 RepID=UPI003ECAE343